MISNMFRKLLRSVAVPKISDNSINHLILFSSVQPTISNETMMNIQNRVDVSDNALLDIATSLRADGVKLESGLKGSLSHSGKVLSEHFEVKNFDMEVKYEGKVVKESKPVVLCKDIDKFVEHVKTKRGMEGPVILRYGLDGGGTLSKKLR